MFDYHVEIPLSVSSVNFLCCVFYSILFVFICIVVTYEAHFLDPGITPNSDSIADGRKEGEGILYHANSYPWDPVGVVWFLWKYQPCADRCNTGDLPDVQPHEITSLWVWCHPSIHEEVLQLFTAAADEYDCSHPSSKPENLKESRSAVSLSKAEVDSSQRDIGLDAEISQSSDVPLVSVCSLRDELLRFRLVGPKSKVVLSTVLMPEFDLDSCSDDTKMEGVLHLKSTKEWEEVSKKSKLRKWWEAYMPPSRHTSLLCNDLSKLPFGCVIGMTLIDPRLFTPIKRDSLIAAVIPKSRKTSTLSSFLHEGIGSGDLDMSESESGSDSSVSDGTGLCYAPQITRSTPPASKSTSLSHASSEVEPLPTELAFSPLWDSSIRSAVSNFIPHHVLNEVRSKFFLKPKVLNLGHEACRVPVLLVNKSQEGGLKPKLAHRNVHVPAVTSWDIILPRCWGMAFWISLVYHGGRACGVKELERTSLELLQPVFPRDFPDTKPGMDLSVENKLLLEAKYCRYPPDKRPNFGKLQINTPFYSPWSTLVKEHQKLFGEPEGEQSLEDLSVQPKRAKVSLEPSTEGRNTPTSVISDIPMESLSPTKKVSLPREFYVLRESKYIHALLQFTEQLLSRSLPPGIAYATLVQQHEIAKLSTEQKSALLLIQAETARQGVLTHHSTLFLPTMEDLRQFRENKDYSGPSEDKASRGLTLVENGELCIGVYQTTRKEMKSQTSKSNRRKIKSLDTAGKGILRV